MNEFIGFIRDGRLHGSPMPESHDGCRVLWRGYIANASRLIAEARDRGTNLEGASSARLFAWAYRRWGRALQAHVTGEYAAALFDERDHSLLLTHDAFGLVPLFYRSGAELAFGSNLERLCAGAGDRDLDPDYFADYLANPSRPRERTPYHGVRRLGPGRSLVWKDGRIEECCTWDLDRIAPLTLANDEAYEERLLGLLEEAIEAVRPSRGTAWTELSGGLDSSTVACLAARAGYPGLSAISLVFGRSSGADETRWIREVLEKTALPWHPIDGDESPPYGSLPDRFCAEPNLAMIHWGWRRRYEETLTAHGVDVLLTGQGGDLVFLGPGAEPFYLADLARPFRLGRLASELRRWRQADTQHRSMFYWLAHRVAGPLVRHARRLPLRRPGQPGYPPWLRPEFVRSMHVVERGRPSSFQRCRTVGGQWFSEALTATCALVATQNQSTRGYALRHPLLYRPLVEFVAAIPWEQKMSPGDDRHLQRRALRGILPERIRRRRSKPALDQPYIEGLRQGAEWLSALTDQPLIEQRGIVNGPRWREAVSQARAGRFQDLPAFEATATLEIWLRQFDAPRRSPSVAVAATTV